MNNINFCGNCGQKLIPGAQFCPKCGMRITNNVEEISKTMSNGDVVNEKHISTENDSTKNIRKNTRKYVPIIVFVAVVFLLLGKLFFSSGTENENRTESKDSEFDIGWYKTYSYFKNNSTGEVVRIDNYDDGYIYVNVNDTGLIDTHEEDYKKTLKGAYSYISSVGEFELLYYPEEGHVIEIVKFGETTRYTLIDQSEYSALTDPLERLRSKASEMGCTTTFTFHDTSAGYQITIFDDDQEYYDEVVLDAWYDENGVPKAMWLPAAINHNADMDFFHFIDGRKFSMDDLKRTSPDGLTTYAMIIKNISKRTDEYGNIMYEGIDYISGETVIIHGEFSKVLNGDDILVFAEFRGLASDDTPNFNGCLMQIINNREIDS